MSDVRVAVLPPIPPLEDAVRAGGGTIAAPEDADAIVWCDPTDPQGLQQVLKGSKARWVQLPFAGIESFFEAGVIDPARTWTCTKGAYGPATAEQALGLLLTAARVLHLHARARTWMPRFEIPQLGGNAVPMRPRRVAGTTALIVGTGGIGRALASWLGPLGVRVIGVNRSGAPMPGAERTVPVGEMADELGHADWVVLAAPHTAETNGLFDAATLRRMAPGSWLINVARGPLVDTDALVDALRNGVIAGAALDVTDPEPLPDDHPLWGMDNVIITSHTGNTAEMAIPDLGAMVTRNVRAFAAGEPLDGVVDPALGY